MPLTANDPTRNPNALLPDGSFRGARLPAALATTYVNVDEKAATDWLEIVRRLAPSINFVKADNTVEGDWRPFYEKQRDVATAKLMAWPLERLGQRFAEHRELIEDHQSSIPPEQLLESLFDLLTSAVVALDGLTERLDLKGPLRERAESLIAHQLAPAFRRWIAYYRAGATAYFPIAGVDQVPDYLRDAYAAGGTIFSTQELIDGSPALKPRWTGGLSWTDYLTEVGTNEIVYGTSPTVAGAEEEIMHAVGHAFFHGVYEALVSSALHLRAAAQIEWQRLQSDPNHAAHLALLLAYLRMREVQQRMLNGLTDRHLRYYYNRVLRTEPAPARPPRALLHLEARKNLPPTYLPTGTEFRGGKDEETGTERIFLSQQAVTVSEATIVEQRALFRVANNPSVYDFPGENRKVFAAGDASRYYSATVVESADGLGEIDLPEDQEGFYPFGHRSLAGGHLSAGMQQARVGIAIASHYLYLREGERTVTLRFEGMPDVIAPAIELNIFLTIEEGWHPLIVNLSGKELSFTLQPNDPAILPYSEKIHRQGLGTELPVIRLELPQKSGVLGANQRLFARSFSRVYIGLEVNGIRQLALTGSAGTIDPSKPFHPFGPAPRKGDVLYIGHPESFQKEEAVVTFAWSWADGSTPDSVSVQQTALQNGDWHYERTVPLNDGGFTDIFHSQDLIEPDFAPPIPYVAGASGGYLRLKLNSDWGHADYPAALANWSAGKANGDSVGDPPNLPYNPLFADITLSYTLDEDDTQVRESQHGQHQLFHLTPFGSLTLPASGARKLLPTLLPQSGGAVGADAGAMYLGIKAWEAGSQLSLLLQIVEGTADPLLEKPDGHVRWHYLADNRWTIFPTDKLSDGTDGLLRSGLVRLDLPANTKPRNTRFGDELQWIRLSVEQKVDAVNRLLGVHAHGVEVVQEFRAGQTATDAPLPAGTIAKLVRPLPGIKTVAQPYPTFGGAAVEDRDAYFTRLSERLRHKNRGITEWDVEHLVLGAFPQVERVICLQHVEFEPGAIAGTYTYHELRAGHFTVLPMGRTGGSGLRPYVSLSTREAIYDFLRSRISCHAVLHVRNPLFEDVIVRADVKYVDGTDESWAETQVNLDLIEYISPWHDGGLAGLDFTAEVHRSGVVNYLEERYYVDYVKNLTLLHTADPTQNGSERLRPTKLVAVLASAPQHEITTLTGEADPGLTEVCSPTRRRSRGTTVTITDNIIIT